MRKRTGKSPLNIVSDVYRSMDRKALVILLALELGTLLMMIIYGRGAAFLPAAIALMLFTAIICIVNVDPVFFGRLVILHASPLPGSFLVICGLSGNFGLIYLPAAAGFSALISGLYFRLIRIRVSVRSDRCPDQDLRVADIEVFFLPQFLRVLTIHYLVVL